MLDVLVQNGQVIDGTGAPRYRADVGIQSGRFVAVGTLGGAKAETVIDAAGCVVTPGFVDMHSHADLTLPVWPTADSMVRQGITTTVIGQCGLSPAPLLDGTRAQMVEMMDSKEAPLPWDEWSTLGDYLDYLRRAGISINAIPLVGQGTVRAAVMGYAAGPASEEQIAQMQQLVIGAMQDGAIGISAGLIYPPGSYAATEELIAVTRPVGDRGGTYFSHIRGESDTLLDAVAEAIRIGRETGAAVQISHFKAAGRKHWPRSPQALALIDRARAKGQDVTADMYPYLAGSTGLAALLPEWTQEGGKAMLLQRLRDPQTRKQMAAEMHTRGFASAVEWDGVLISSSPANRTYEGCRIADLAAERTTDAYTWVFDALLELALDASIIVFHSSEDNRRQELRHPAMMIGTDGSGLADRGPLSGGKPHPRNYGTFPRVLARYSRELGVLSLEEAIQKMTGLPAQKLHWSDRGLVKVGYRADLVVLDPDTVTDRATFEAPHQYPYGIPHVIVNGQPVVHHGVHTEARPGSVLGRQ
jgi:N-acyl-D-aspartate/D-glutamate deacylase